MKRFFLVIPLVLSLAVSLFLYRDLLGKEGKRIAWRIKEKETRSRMTEVPILLYHGIDGKGVYSVDHETLRRHFQFFKDKGIHIISLKELENRLENPEVLQVKTAVITFDDGYKTMYTELLPLVSEFHYPVTLFVYLDFIHVRSQTNLTWDQLRELDRGGVDIQSHTISHVDLTINCDDAALFREMFLSRMILELYLNKRIDYFAFPFGRYNQQIIARAEDCGYSRVFSTDDGPNVITRDNFCLRRHHIKRTYSLEFLEQLIR